MSNARGETDRIRCDVSNCRVSVWFGGWGHGLSNKDARIEAAKVGWSLKHRDLCPKHAHLAERDALRAAAALAEQGEERNR